LIVYNHFPDDAALLEACSRHWWALHPLPDTTAWAAIDDLEERSRAALRDLYAYFEETGPMTEKFLRAATLVPAIADLLDRTWHPYFRDARDAVAGAPGGAGEGEGEARSPRSRSSSTSKRGARSSAQGFPGTRQSGWQSPPCSPPTRSSCPSTRRQMIVRRSWGGCVLDECGDERYRF
jgi:AcrR family transcriptional regulator